MLLSFGSYSLTKKLSAMWTKEKKKEENETQTALMIHKLMLQIVLENRIMWFLLEQKD